MGFPIAFNNSFQLRFCESSQTINFFVYLFCLLSEFADTPSNKPLLVSDSLMGLSQDPLSSCQIQIYFIII